MTIILWYDVDKGVHIPKQYENLGVPMQHFDLCGVTGQLKLLINGRKSKEKRRIRGEPP